MKHIPVATYRLQFNRQFTFRQAIEIVDYLRELGISDIYASPLFTAGTESTHGYDVCCFSQFNPQLGGETGFAELSAALKANGLHLLLDMVPNHMSATDANAWWMDVLEHGRDSKYADFFDIDWDPPNPALKNKVLLPVLEDEYEKVLESGKLRLVSEQEKKFIAYYDKKFPVSGAPSTGSAPVAELLAQQHYLLADWRTAADQINYRRFFDVTELVALKNESPDVFHATHHRLFELLRDGKISGLRIDHPDGLWNPKQYFERLQREAEPLYVIAEKILSDHEQLPRDWPVDGTTGYDFLNLVNGLFVNTTHVSGMDQIYGEFSGNEWTFAEVAHRSKTRILEKSFAGELTNLTHRLTTVADHSHTGTFDFTELRAALREVIACFPVYRTYADDSSVEVSAQDEAAVDRAVADAKNRTDNSAAIDFIAQMLKLQFPASPTVTRRFVMKFQQLTGPAAAKGIEDTAFYRFNRLVSLNEVGGNPERFGISLEEFHNANRATAERWPHTLLATATHDTKRGEDVRARIDVLSEMPGEWREAVLRWSKCNAGKKTIVSGKPAPDANDEYLFYQTLIGAWPTEAAESLQPFQERLTAFMLKAVKEAKLHTSWTEPNADYETAVRQFITQTLADPAFVSDMRKFHKRIAFFGRINSLAQTLLKITSPGVPDFYQGSELWDLTLVDPDNRRPVDFTSRGQMLAHLKRQWPIAHRTTLLSGLLRDELPGAVKQFLIWRALNFRREHPEFFQQADYTPLLAQGEKHEHICAFARAGVIVIVPRLVFGLTDGSEILPLGRNVWQDTFVPLPVLNAPTAFKNVLTGETVLSSDREQMPCVEIAETLKQFPVALLATATRNG